MHILTTSGTLTARYKILGGLFFEVIEGLPKKALERYADCGGGMSYQYVLDKVVDMEGSGKRRKETLIKTGGYISVVFRSASW